MSLSYAQRVVLLLDLLMRRRVTFASFRAGLRPTQVAICVAAGGQMFCDVALEREYFGPEASMTDIGTPTMPAPLQPTVIFHGTPAQVINLPSLLGGIASVAVIVAAYAWASSRWALPSAVAIVPALLCVLHVARAFLRTTCTEILIDVERITCRQGILSRRVSSVELFRIQDVISLHPWWQRFFNIGTVVVLTSDPDFPRWTLPGMVDAERLRNTLNWSAIALRDRKGIREFNVGWI